MLDDYSKRVYFPLLFQIIHASNTGAAYIPFAFGAPTMNKMLSEETNRPLMSVLSRPRNTPNQIKVYHFYS